MLFDCIFILVLHFTSNIKSANAWDKTSVNQYHIQNDEGPQRYFRYQTDGQYRKEKRLEDGTVVGTYAWIDDNGVLQKQDYMADNSGYRILKTANIFVGRHAPIEQAMKAITKFHTPSGNIINSEQNIGLSSYNTIESGSTQSKFSSTAVDRATPFEDKYRTGILSTTPSVVIGSNEAPMVEITANSLYSTQLHPLHLVPNLTTHSDNKDNTYISSAHFPIESSNLPTPAEPYKIKSQYDANNNEMSKQITKNYLEYINQVDSSFSFENGPTYPLDTSGKLYLGQSNKRKVYDSKSYDDISVTNDGFRYYIPRAYHEEETLPGNKRSGSFGYIDPFGIRRVIYYNTASEGRFQHKKHNRYVGFQSSPYEPRPY